MYNNSKVAKAIRLAMMVGAGAAATISVPTFAAEEVAEEKVERIQITGSKIKRIGELSPTPVTVISGDAFVKAGITNVADLLSELPAAAVGISPETSNNNIYANGLNTTDLRGLGSSKTLVLVNGRRFVAGSPGSSSVDLNNIPTAMVDRMEITTGGASAIYGSDAVAGVVNIITKKSFDGIEVDASGSIPTEDGGEESYLSLTFGDEGEKSSFIANISYAKQEQLAGHQRDFLVNGPIAYDTPDNVDNEDGIPRRSVWKKGNTKLGYYSPTGDFFMADGHYIFADDGTIRPFEQNDTLPASLTPGSRNTNYFAGEGDGYHFLDNKYVRTPLERLNVTTQYNYNINDDHTMSFEFLYSDTSAYGESSPIFKATSLRADNAFFSDETQQFFADRDVSSFTAYNTTDVLGHRKYEQDRSTVRAALSFEGIISDDWSYDAYIQKGQVSQITTWHGEMLTQNYENAIDAVNWNGEIVCADRNDAGEVIGAKSGCSPINLWGKNLASQEALDYVGTTAMRDATIDQMSAAVTVSGDLFELPAGTVASAFSLEYREEESTTRPDSGIQGGIIFGNQSASSAGKFDVIEAAVEVSVPLITDSVIADDIFLELAYRYMDYSSTGNDYAYKVGLTYILNDEFTMRGNVSRSVRAPNITELYSPGSQTFASFSDPCGQGAIDNASAEKKGNVERNCRADGIPVNWEPSDDWKRTNNSGFVSGNAELTNEVADDYTIGFVYNPSFIEGLGLTVDYWSFEFDNEISYPDDRTIAKKCYESESLDNLYCTLIERTAGTYEIDNFLVRPINSASSKMSGLDLEVNYAVETSFGNFSPRLIATYNESREGNDTGFEEDFYIEDGEQRFPKWKASFITNYAYEDLSLTLKINYRASTVEDNEWDAEQNNYNDIHSYTTFDLTGRYQVTDALEVRAGILNMFDRTPPANPFSYDEGEFYDLFGQRITLGVNYKF
ncbi:TonB-dependent receptor [Colwellia asteriadis]|uniref:TonB-dependent receptor n=1 Tax=Colwellia asteriadis TaxID=517723 RepID=A0ABN1L6S7_9GAMM